MMLPAIKPVHYFRNETGAIACDKQLRGVSWTDTPNAVTCPECREWIAERLSRSSPQPASSVHFRYGDGLIAYTEQELSEVEHWTDDLAGVTCEACGERIAERLSHSSAAPPQLANRANESMDDLPPDGRSRNRAGASPKSSSSISSSRSSSQRSSPF